MPALKAIRQRSIMARMMRKMQVPAYVPEDEGVQAEEKSGVLWAFVKTMVIVMVVEELEEELEPLILLISIVLME
jgi:hypothetical protein